MNVFNSSFIIHHLSFRKDAIMPIFDQGYQHWRGPLSSHVWRWLTIARHGVRVQGKNRILRILLLFAWLPALALIVAVALWGLVEQKSEGLLNVLRQIPFVPQDLIQDPRSYRGIVWTLGYSFFFKTEMFFIMLLVAIAGPGLISQDLRFNALPLYLARPLTRLDYFLGKLGVIGALVASVAVGPAVFAYVVGVCFSFDLSVVRDTWKVLLGSVAYGLVVTLSVGTFMLALSSLTRRSLYVGIAWAGIWLISSTVGSILTAVHAESVRHQVRADEMNRWIDNNPPPEGAQIHRSPDTVPYPVMQVDQETHKYQLVGIQPGHEAEGERWYRKWQEAQQRTWVDSQEDEAAVVRNDWRPLCSYVANLERMGDLLLDTDAAWVSVGRAVERTREAGRMLLTPGQRQREAAEAERAARLAAAEGARGKSAPRAEKPRSNERFLADRMVPQYPWWWSACVLAGLMGLSSWTLTRRVKSLDRLK
jgi:ABC-type transport system involved in multi-copper enzyme maturation permease subunit